MMTCPLILQTPNLTECAHPSIPATQPRSATNIGSLLPLSNLIDPITSLDGHLPRAQIYRQILGNFNQTSVFEPNNLIGPNNLIRRPITSLDPYNLIRRPPPTRTDLPADTRQFNQTSVFEPCSEPHTFPSPATIAAGCPSVLNLRAYYLQRANKGNQQIK